MPLSLSLTDHRLIAIMRGSLTPSVSAGCCRLPRQHAAAGLPPDQGIHSGTMRARMLLPVYVLLALPLAGHLARFGLALWANRPETWPAIRVLTTD